MKYWFTVLLASNGWKLARRAAAHLPGAKVKVTTVAQLKWLVTPK
jgi:hypothetical protein